MAPCIGICGYYKLKLNNETWATDSPKTKSQSSNQSKANKIKIFEKGIKYSEELPIYNTSEASNCLPKRNSAA
jgi:hypothetical protein